jgi:hypothetical protein
MSWGEKIGFGVRRARERREEAESRKQKAVNGSWG